MKIPAVFFHRLVIFTLTLSFLLLASSPLASADSLETPVNLNAVQFIPQNLLQGVDYRVQPEVENDGLNNRYTIESEYGQYREIGTYLTLVRISEFAAIRKLREIDSESSISEGAVGVGKDKVGAVKTLVTNPVATLKSMPKGASRFLGSVGEGLKQSGSKYEGDSTDSLLGISAAKQKLAASLKVNPYTTNEVLAHELTRVAQAKGITDRIVNLGLGVATGGAAGLVLTGVGVSETLMEAIAEEPPAQVRIRVRKALMENGVSQEIADEFTAQPYLSPTHQAVIAGSLVSVNNLRGIEDFIKATLTAGSETDAIFFQRTALLIASYNKHEIAVTDVALHGILPVLIDINGRLVVPLHMDYAIWSERAKAKADALVTTMEKEDSIKSLGLYTDGQMSEMFEEELTKRYFAVGVSTNLSLAQPQ